MKAILLSIKPEYVAKILDGTKKYEYRKRLAKAECSTILIYSTSPVMKVVAKVEIIGTICAAPSTLWEETKSNAGISRKNTGNIFTVAKALMPINWDKYKYLMRLKASQTLIFPLLLSLLLMLN